ncbi:methyl-accepting chemotaxis protein [Hydrogenophaga sp. RWCD_12]|uniref:methyl-accepting chemotaxis protein n=1 Tax=Hydrogenophaga sp. RWCD_12 TaxID=3391190 RepID=UPI0039855F0D
MWIGSLMRRFSIRFRMISAIAVVLSLLFMVGGAGFWGMQQLQRLNHELSDHAFHETVTLSKLRQAMADLSRHEKDMVIQYESPEQLSLASMYWEKTRTEITRLSTELQQGDDDEDNAVLRGMEAKLKEYSAAVEPVVENIKKGSYDSATVANRMLERAHERYGSMQADLKKVEEIIAGEAASVITEEGETSRQTMLWFGLAVALSVLIVIPTTLANMQSICKPLDQAQQVAMAIAQGDLTRNIPVQGQDELTRLMHALGGMQDALARIVSEVRHSTDRISLSSAEIASGNQDLSLRTEQTAGNLQQTASSIEQINSTVQQSAESARQASAMAQANAAVAARGGQVVSEVVATMEEINHRSQKISDIIGVIDGIAFQTNILALNAAVEAARAGEQGRGFAVVAGEVRSLAQRSAEAAKEIKGLIGASVEKVEAGTRQVAEAGSTIGEIVANAQKISALINDITSAANEQSQGIGQVNGAVGQLDQMTQQNAALVEESAAAAQSLKDQAEKLAGVVATFRLSVG